ncbi:hypothetical protein ES703_51594 [subsurface metagenome]
MHISPAQSAGAVSRRRKLLGVGSSPAAPAGAEGEAAKGRGGMETAPTSDMWQGWVKFPLPRARRDPIPGIFARDRRGPPQLGNFNF